MSEITVSLTIVNGQPIATSLDVAEKFEKPHADVLKAIRKLMDDLPAEFNEGNFSFVEYTDSKGEKRPMYNLTRDAFSLLAMGFTGRKRLTFFQLAHILTSLHPQAASAAVSQIAPQTAR